MMTPSPLISMQVDVTVELDASLHGWEIAQNENSNEQARLLAGMAQGFEDLNPLKGSLQLAYLAESVKQGPEGTEARVRWMLTELLEHLS